jgi:membrane protease YdiL (CAAX protease family)
MGLLSAALQVAAVWTLLAAGLGPTLAFSLAAGALLLTRPAHASRARSPGLLIACALGAVCSYPAWACGIGWSGSLLGLPARVGGPFPGPLEAAALLSTGPVFEELLYRERLLPAVERRVGTSAAVLVSSAAFALPHVDPWTTLAALWVGPALGALYVATRNVWACTAAHAALNAVALWTAPG